MPKRRRSSAKDSADVPEEELQRRRRQQELREAALKLRAVGKEYDKKRRPKSLQPGAKKQRTGPAVAVPQMVVLPIYWNSKVDERERVLSVANKALAVLQAAGVDVRLDADDTYTPGQKMKYWETKGVKVRVEIGPKEALAGTCLLARANKPGEVANKNSVNIDRALKGRALAALADAGIKVEPPAAADAAVLADAQPPIVGKDAGTEAGVGDAAAGDAAKKEGGKDTKAKKAATQHAGGAEADHAAAALSHVAEEQGEEQGDVDQQHEPKQSKQEKGIQQHDAKQQAHQPPCIQQPQGAGKSSKKQKVKHGQQAGSGADPATRSAPAANYGQDQALDTALDSEATAQPQQQATCSKQRLVSGDAMDDFVIEVQEEGLQRKQAKSKDSKKRKGKTSQAEGSGAQAGEAFITKPKRAKMVVF